MKKIIILAIFIGLLLPFFSFAQQSVSPPENIDEVKAMGQKAGTTIKEDLPGELENIFKEQVLPVWEKMYNWSVSNIWSKIDNWFQVIFQPLLKSEVEKRKPVVKEEFQKEKQELKQEAPQVGQTLWERFKELIK